jgi:hypothetical protein
MGKYLDLLTAITDPSVRDQSDISDQRAGFCRFGRILEGLERRCPDHVDAVDWEQAIADARAFLPLWDEQAEALGWTSADLFGLAPVPEQPATNYRRLSRYDLTGLLWLLKGRPVVALSETTAAIQTVSGAILTYRRHRKPALGPLGDCLDDLDAWSSPTFGPLPTRVGDE